LSGIQNTTIRIQKNGKRKLINQKFLFLKKKIPKKIRSVSLNLINEKITKKKKKTQGEKKFPNEIPKEIQFYTYFCYILQ
jgi:hypothetical protein